MEDESFKIQDYATATAWRLKSSDDASRFISLAKGDKWKFIAIGESIGGIQKNKEGELYFELYYPGDPDSEKKQVLFDTPEEAYRAYIQILAKVLK